MAAIAAGELDMTVVPTTNTGTQTSFTLTQTTKGVDGNTAITLITGATANGETSFINGGGDSASVCTGPIGTYYVDGPVGGSGKKVWLNNNSTGVPTTGTYIQVGSSIAFHWNGSIWRSLGTICE